MGLHPRLSPLIYLCLLTGLVSCLEIIMFPQHSQFTLLSFADMTELLVSEKGNHPQTVPVCPVGAASSTHRGPHTVDESVY